MKRLLVYQMHDPDGIVDPYIRYTLKGFDGITDKKILVSNGKLRPDEKQNIYTLVDRVCERDDTCLDAGAFCDYFLRMNCERLDHYDEIFLMNDSVYGPMFPLQIFLSENAPDEKVDFWGISGYYYNDRNTGEEKKSLPAWFIGIRKHILQSEDFINYWKSIDGKITNAMDAARLYEEGMTDYYLNCGYSMETVIPLYSSIGEGIRYGQQRSIELIRAHKNPFIKRKAFSIWNYRTFNSMIDYLDRYEEYDSTMIIKNLHRLAKIRNYVPYAIEGFISKYNQYFVFGEGAIGSGVKEFLDIKRKNFAGFVTSEGSETSISLKNLVLDKTDGMIVSVAVRHLDMDNLRERILSLFPAEQLYFVSNY